MGKIFDYDNNFFAGISKVSDTIILNFLFVICSIPIVTIGASTTALYCVSMKSTRDEDVYAVKEFFKQFKQNFKESTIIWLILLLVASFIGLDFYMCSLMSIKHLPYTLIMLVLTLMPLGAFVLFGKYWGQIVFLDTCISFGVIAYINSMLLNKIFNGYIED